MIIEIKLESKVFYVDFNKEQLLKDASDLLSHFEENCYVSYGKSPEWDDPYLTEEQYKGNIQKFISEIELIDESKLYNLVSEMPKKKNGKFSKNCVCELCSCGNTVVLHEWHNTWIYEQVVAKAINEDTLLISMRELKDTPG